MPTPRLSAAALALLIVAVFASCGGADTTDEPSSDDIVRDLTHKKHDERHLRNLERQVDRLEAKRERATTTPKPAPDSAPATSGGLGDIDALGSSLGGEIGVAVGAPGTGAPVSAGTLTSGSAWSTIKVPIALAVLRDVGGPQALSTTQRQQIESALTASDNAAAAELFEYLGARHGGVAGAAAAVTDVLRGAGDGATVVSTQGRDGFSPYGQTDWPLAAQERFMAALVGGCAADGASTEYVLDVMGRVTSDTWGLGSIGVPARWKGGWGPGADGRYLVRQMGVIDLDGKQLILSIAARADDGQYATSQTIATQLAQRVLADARGLAASPAAC